MTKSKSRMTSQNRICTNFSNILLKPSIHAFVSLSLFLDIYHERTNCFLISLSWLLTSFLSDESFLSISCEIVSAKNTYFLIEFNNLIRLFVLFRAPLFFSLCSTSFNESLTKFVAFFSWSYFSQRSSSV